MTESDIDEMGPVDYLVIEFPADRPPNGSALPLLLDLVERGIIRVLDLAFVRKDRDGSVAGIDISEVGLEGEMDVTLFAEASSGLLDGERWATQGQAVYGRPAQYAPESEPEPMPAQPPAGPPPGGTDRIAALKDLAELKAQGVLTEAEFEREKARILAA